MERIHYAGDTVLTGSDIAHALLAYARALADSDASATIEIPIYHEDGTRGVAEFLIGPASQIVTESTDSDWDEIVDEETVAGFAAATRGLGASRPISSDRGDMGDFPEFVEP